MLCLVACKKSDAPVEAIEPVQPVQPAPAVAPPAPPPEPVAEEAPEAPEGVDAMVRALSARDGAPTCAEVEAMSPTPVDALRHIVDHVQMPPQAPMRAAACMTAYGEAVRDDLVRWVSEPELQGLGRLVLGDLASLPAPLAAEVVKAAADGPLKEQAVQAAAEDGRVELQTD
jgi:hypothetical protein